MQISAHSNPAAAAAVPVERLANNQALSQEQKVGEASRQFEAILLRQILDAAQKPVISSKLSNNSTSASIYRDMITNQLADSISKSGGFGLAATFSDQLSPHLTKGTETDPHTKGQDASSASPRVNGGRVPSHSFNSTHVHKTTHS